MTRTTFGGVAFLLVTLGVACGGEGTETDTTGTGTGTGTATGTSSGTGTGSGTASGTGTGTGAGGGGAAGGNGGGGEGGSGGGAPAEIVRFIAMGDGGEGNGTQLQVAQAIKAECDARGGCMFALYLGDNIYNTGVDSAMDSQFQSKFEVPYMDLELSLIHI